MISMVPCVNPLLTITKPWFLWSVSYWGHGITRIQWLQLHPCVTIGCEERIRSKRCQMNGKPKFWSRKLVCRRGDGPVDPVDNVGWHHGSWWYMKYSTMKDNEAQHPSMVFLLVLCFLFWTLEDSNITMTQNQWFSSLNVHDVNSWHIVTTAPRLNDSLLKCSR